ncbi:MAG: universal stress protein [Bacteroidetes bacterium]|nr:universal stress protein [Bacteroidota bacterium]
MLTNFKNILVPVDFSINAEVAIKKAIELIDNNDGTIHLLHVKKNLAGVYSALVNNHFTTTVTGVAAASEQKAASYKLYEWKQILEEEVPMVKVNLHLLEGGGVQDRIINLSTEVRPQLIVIGKHQKSKWFTKLSTVTPHRIAKITNCPVLSLCPGAITHHIRSIVIPVRDFIPKRKIDIVVNLAKDYRAKIYLVSITGKNKYDENSTNPVFIKTYRLLRDVLNSTIEFRVLSGNNLAKAAFEFAESIHADMLLVNPVAETKVSNITGEHIHDLLPYDSPLQIMAVEPYHHQ